jgi:hypothetical protein
MPVIEHLKAVLKAEFGEAVYAMAWTPGLAQLSIRRWKKHWRYQISL